MWVDQLREDSIWTPSVADANWGGGKSACCIAGPIDELRSVVGTSRLCGTDEELDAATVDGGRWNWK